MIKFFRLISRWFVVVLMCGSWTISTTSNPSPNAEFASMINDYVYSRYKHHHITEYIYVSVRYQQLYLIRDTTIILQYPVSTALKGTGSEFNSEKTPLGLHRVSHQLGDNAPVGGVIGPTGYTGKNTDIGENLQNTGKDEVTTRALRLEGMEPGKNKGGNNDSYLREIYIHGTPEEGSIGKPVSHGCIRMKNRDIIGLFERAKAGMFVLILPY